MIPEQVSNLYSQTAIQTADPLQLIILCYDAAISDLKQAKELHQKSEMNEAYRSIRHAQDVITELLVGLDYERGGDIARDLNRIYNFVIRQLIGINSRKDVALYDELVRILSNLRDGWQTLKLSSGQSSITGGVLPRQWRACA
ncbi:MAG: flagellar export chaperone FliS [Syntrophobacteraceae bacterium]